MTNSARHAPNFAKRWGLAPRPPIQKPENQNSEARNNGRDHAKTNMVVGNPRIIIVRD